MIVMRHKRVAFLMFFAVVAPVLSAAGCFAPSDGLDTLLDEYSPDGRFRVVLTKRVILPPNEILDPSVHVEVRVTRAGDDVVLSEQSFDLFEDSDVGEPKAIWGAQHVLVTGMDRPDVVLPLTGT
jgi:hypothetical protein